ncbi:MAG: MFS transporter [Promethearchaeota archaeon]
MEELVEKNTFRSYLFFWSGQLVSILGSLIVQFVIIVWITLETGSLLMLSLANFFFMFPTLIIAPIAGVFTDRYNRKKIIIIVDSTQAFLTIILIGCFALNLINIIIIFLFISLRSSCQAFHSPAVMAIVPTMVPKDKLSRMNGLDFLFSGLIQIIGAPVGATLLIFFHIQYILWVDVITFLIALVPLLLIKIPIVTELTEAPEKNSFLKDFKLGFKTLRVIPGLLVLLVIAMLVNFFLQPLFVLMPFYILNKHGGTVFILGLMEMIIPASSLLGAVITSIKKSWKNKISVIFTGLMIVNLGYLIYALAPNGSFIIISIGAFMLGVVLPIINSIAQTIFQTVIPKDKFGRVSSIIITLSMVISPLGAIISGPLSILFGLTNLYLYCAIIGIIIGILSYFFTSLRHIDYDKEFEFAIPEN